ncbi:MAG: APC family permease [Fervidicoccaceae archaeon]
MEEEETFFVRRASGLVRELNWYDIIVWVLATPAASGMTYYAVKILGDPSVYGGNLPLAFFIAGLMFLPLVVAFIMIASSFPRTSSLYVVVSRVIHPVIGFLPFWYFIVGGGAAMASGYLLFIGIKAMSGPLVVSGLASGNQLLINIANSLTDPTHQLLIALILVLVIWMINYTGMKVIKWSVRLLTIIPLVITLVALAVTALSGRDAGISRFDAIYGNGTAEAIMNAALNQTVATSLGITPLTPNSMLTGTYNMLLWTIWAWTGMEVVTFVGSEVKNPSRSYMKGYLIGFLGVMILYLLNAFIIPSTFNYDFLASYSYLKSQYGDVLTNIMHGLPAPDPSVPFFVSLIYPAPIVAILLGFAYFLWYVNTVLPIWIAAVRGFFSLSFDRALPEKLSEISPRFSSPTWANHVTAIIAVLGAFLTLLETIGFNLAASAISFMDFSTLLFIWPVGLSLMILPWWKADMFGKMTFPSKTFTSIIGALVFAIGWYFMIMTSYTDPSIVLINILVGLIGLALFTVMIARNKARGIDPSKIYANIPPA